VVDDFVSVRILNVAQSQVAMTPLSENGRSMNRSLRRTLPVISHARVSPPFPVRKPNQANAGSEGSETMQFRGWIREPPQR